MWFKYGLKAQKFLAQGNGCKQHALKGQKLLAQGIALGIMSVSNAPCKGKSFTYHKEFSSFIRCILKFDWVYFKAFALTGRWLVCH